MLADAGMSYEEITHKIYTLNDQCPSPLKKDEIQLTVLKSLAQKMAKK
jgi:hypothetical protein